MKNRIRKSLSALIMLSVLIFMSMLVYMPPMTAYAYENTETATVKGNMVDVSSNNGIVDFDSLVANGVTKVIIRLGFGSDLESQDDSQFYRNVSECERLGIDYGLYLYSYALEYEEAYSEASHALRLAKQCNPTLGVWTDYEDADGYKTRHNFNYYSAENRSKLTDYCIIFISTMRDNGYETGVYANYSWFNNVLQLDRLQATSGFQMWLAHWGINGPSMDCKIWQFGDFGLDKAFDGNIYYGDFNTVITPPSEVDYTPIYEDEINVDNTVHTYYQVQIDGNRWLPVVQDDQDYAGIVGHKITGIAIKVSDGYCKYRVHTRSGWHGLIDSDNTDINDYINGYAGNGEAIDKVEVYYYTPSEIACSTGYQCANYRVSPLNCNYYSIQIDDKTVNGMDGYAGCTGNYIDRFQITIN